jgi:hypothetical protein
VRDDLVLFVIIFFLNLPLLFPLSFTPPPPHLISSPPFILLPLSYVSHHTRTMLCFFHQARKVQFLEKNEGPVSRRKKNEKCV